MNNILYCDATKPTALELAALLDIEPISRAGNRKIDKLIRWGSTLPLPMRPGSVLNKRKALLKAIDKFQTLLNLNNYGVRVPRFFDLTSTANDLLQVIDFPCLARKKNHTQGKDIILCLQLNDLQQAKTLGCDYAIKYISTKKEYRVHVFQGSIIKTSEKVLTDVESHVPYIRNVEHGYTFRHERTNLSKESEWLAVEAVEALGLDFGAVDLIVSDTGIPYVLEVNTGPSLVDSGIEKYGEAIKLWLES